MSSLLSLTDSPLAGNSSAEIHPSPPCSYRELQSCNRVVPRKQLNRQRLVSDPPSLCMYLWPMPDFHQWSERSIMCLNSERGFEEGPSPCLLSPCTSHNPKDLEEGRATIWKVLGSWVHWTRAACCRLGFASDGCRSKNKSWQCLSHYTASISLSPQLAVP